MTLPELLDAQVRFAVKDTLTDRDVVWLRKINKTFELYREHRLGEVMGHWHDLGCEMDSHATHLEFRGSSADVHRSEARNYHERAESIRLQIVGQEKIR